MLAPAELARVEELETARRYQQAGLQDVQGALRNRVYDNHSGTATAVTAGMTLNFAAILIQARVSGIFAVSLSFQYSGATAAAANTVAITGQSSAGAITLTNTNAAEGSTAATATNPMTNGGSPGAFTSSAAGGILIGSGGGGPHGFMSQTFTTATGQTTGTFSWSGLADNSTAGGTPFTIGNFVVFLCAVNAGTSPWTITGLNLSCAELIG